MVWQLFRIFYARATCLGDKEKMILGNRFREETKREKFLRKECDVLVQICCRYRRENLDTRIFADHKRRIRMAEGD